MTATIRPYALTALCCLLPGPALSQSVEDKLKEDASIPTLELAPDPEIEKGQVAAIHGTVDTQGVRCIVPSLSILQPVVVMLLTDDESADLSLSLFKKNWIEPQRVGSTRGTGIADFVFRTQGPVRILVRSASGPTPFALVVWAGDELRPPMPDAVITHDEFLKRNPAAAKSLKRSGAGGLAGLPLIVWIGVAAASAGVSGFLARRVLSRRKQP